MATTATPEPIAQPRPSDGRTDGLTVIPGGRGIPERVDIRTTDALAPCLEGIAACDETLAAIERIVIATATGSPYTIVHEANRLRARIQGCRVELARMAGAIDGRAA